MEAELTAFFCCSANSRFTGGLSAVCYLFPTEVGFFADSRKIKDSKANLLSLPARNGSAPNFPLPLLPFLGSVHTNPLSGGLTRCVPSLSPARQSLQRPVLLGRLPLCLKIGCARLLLPRIACMILVPSPERPKPSIASILKTRKPATCICAQIGRASCRERV